MDQVTRSGIRSLPRTRWGENVANPWSVYAMKLDLTLAISDRGWNLEEHPHET